MLKRAVEATPGCDGLILGGHGLFTWGDTQHECYVNSIRTIDEMGEFIQEHAQRVRGSRCSAAPRSPPRSRIANRRSPALLPYLRGVVSSNRRVIAHFDGSDDALTFANSRWAEDLCRMGTSCPDHFLRTRISPMFIPWDPASEESRSCSERIGERVGSYREDYAEYYTPCAEKGSPTLRDSNPSVVVIPGLGLFGFGKDKREARITSEFFVNAIHVMAGANALEDDGGADGRAAAGAAAGTGARLQDVPQLRRAAADRGVPHRVLGARRSEAAADAAGEGVQPEGRRRRRRRQRHRPGGRARDRQARRACRRRRHEHRRRGRDEGGGGAALVAGDGAWRRRWI